MKKANFEFFDHYRFDGNYAVRQYTKSGKGAAVVYCDTLEEAEHQRTWHAKLIGLEPEPTYKDFALYPTIWKWTEEVEKLYDGTIIEDKPRYARMSGY